jgi:hypothetical protein
MRTTKEFWIVENSVARPSEYVMPSGELTYLSLHACRFDSPNQAFAAIADWGLSPKQWGVTRRRLPGTSNRKLEHRN